ncbi:IucA/IucC family protein [Streptomyces sp. N35]|uniref:IucA/IucC family protein n=1 Tax=Streptomyces sp. N35 TaxID=2795730 RepID=UPI0035ABEED2
MTTDPSGTPPAVTTDPTSTPPSVTTDPTSTPPSVTTDSTSTPRSAGEPASASAPPEAVHRGPAGVSDAERPGARRPDVRTAELPEFADLLEHPDPSAAANAAGVENLLRCWIRERDLTPEAGGDVLRIDLPASGLALLAPVHYWSPTGWHRLGPPVFAAAPTGAPPVDAVTVAALLGRETATAAEEEPATGAQPEPGTALAWPAVGDGSDLVGRVADSVRRTTEFLTLRRRATSTSTSTSTSTPTPTLAARGTAHADPLPAAAGAGHPAPTSAASGTAHADPLPAATGTGHPAPTSAAPGTARPTPLAAAPAAEHSSRPPEAPGTASSAPLSTAPSTAHPTPLPAAPSAPHPAEVHAATDATDPGSELSAHPGPTVSAPPRPRTPAYLASSTPLSPRSPECSPERSPDLFLAAEQSLVLGHPLHPTPKSREGLSDAEAERYSPESYGAFALHWMAVAPSVLAADSAWTERGRPVTAEQLTSRLAGPAADKALSVRAAELPDGYALLPLHPWQASDLAHRPEVAELLDRGLIRDLGPLGDDWYPTSSVRTVYRSGAAAMLKLSLGLRITNSRRENLHKELHRGVEVHRLLRSGLSAEWKSAHPGFDIVRDPAWLAVLDTDGAPVTGLDTVIRNNPFTPGDDVTCIAGLVSPRPVRAAGTAGHRTATGHTAAPMRSRLAELVGALAARTGRPRGAVAAEWFLRYLEQVVRPVLWLDGEAGVALEAHQQNTLVVLDPDGWPVGGRHRGNPGYYLPPSRPTALGQPPPRIGVHSDTFVADAVTDERFAYYLGINNVLGLIGAFGSQRLADERLLLAAFRRFLAECASGTGKLRSPLPAQLLETPVLRCKANLLTRLHGLDELVGPVDTQSVYVTIPNPLHIPRT